MLLSTLLIRINIKSLESGWIPIEIKPIIQRVKLKEALNLILNDRLILRDVLLTTVTEYL